MKKLISRLGLLALILAMAFAVTACGGTDSSSDGDSYDDGSQDIYAEENVETDYEDLSTTHYYFRNQDLLMQHYQKHGIEMGFSSAEDYEEGACQVINDPDALYKEEAEDGDECFYIEETNEFVVLSGDGYIRTYFLPDAGKAYFDRQ